jgi:hypothetical protein
MKMLKISLLQWQNRFDIEKAGTEILIKVRCYPFEIRHFNALRTDPSDYGNVLMAAL